MSTVADEKRKLIIGILAIQGAVEEHADLVKRCGGEVREIRLPKDFEGIDGIILPGGESTTMAIVGERWGLFPKLKDWVAEKKPIWGTCAGMILLSDHAIKQARGGQSLVGGLDVRVCRNFFGSQVYSCQVDISLDDSTTAAMAVTSNNSSTKCPAVFIRAPAILSAGPEVNVLASMVAKPHTSARADVLQLIETAKETDSQSSSTDASPIPSGAQIRDKTRVSTIIECTDKDGKDDSSFEVFVAVRQGNILATAFHPELTEDPRWHQYFMAMVAESKK